MTRRVVKHERMGDMDGHFTAEFYRGTLENLMDHLNRRSFILLYIFRGGE